MSSGLMIIVCFAIAKNTYFYGCVMAFRLDFFAFGSLELHCEKKAYYPLELKKKTYYHLELKKKA